MPDLMDVSGTGGPSVLSDDIYVYSVTVLDTYPNGDIKFTCTDMETMEQIVLYRDSFPPLHAAGGDTLWENPISIALATQGILYYIETVRNSSNLGIQFHLMQVNFFLETIESVWSETAYGIEYYVGNTFLAVIKTSELKNILVWDMPVKKFYEVDVNYKSTQYTTDTITVTDFCDPFDAEKIFYNWDVIDNITTRSSYLIDKIYVHTYDLDKEEYLDSNILWENSYVLNEYDEITSVNSVPSPIFYNDKLYISYDITNQGHYITKNATPQQFVYINTGPYAPWYASRNECTFFLPGELRNPYIVQYQYTSNFFGHLFWLLAEFDVITGDVNYEEISNNASSSLTSVNYPGPFSWWADCPNGTPVGCAIPNASWGFAVGSADDYETEIPNQQAPFEDIDLFILFNRPTVYKMVFDVDSESLYIKVGNPDIGFISTDPNIDWLATDDDYKNRPVGIFKIAISDISNQVLTIYPDNLSAFDLLMSKEYAYLLILDEDGIGTVYRFSDGKIVADCGLQYFGENDLEYQDKFRLGCRMTQQASTDEKRIWKLIPYDDENFKIIGYNLEGGSNREYTIIAPFSMPNLGFFNLHQHDGRFILTTEDKLFSPPLIGTWVIT